MIVVGNLTEFSSALILNGRVPEGTLITTRWHGEQCNSQLHPKECSKFFALLGLGFEVDLELGEKMLVYFQ